MRLALTTLVLFPAAVFAFTVPGDACPICLDFPRTSSAQLLIDSASVVLAREDPGQSFSYEAVEVLKGEPGHDDIDLYLDSVTRRLLAEDVSRTVILVKRKPEGPWHSLGIASREYEAIARRVLLLAPTWQGAQGRIKRVNFFQSLVGHQDPRISELVFFEMAQAPYAVTRQLSRIVSAEQIEPLLRRHQYVPLRSLAIILRAHHGGADDRRYIARSFDIALKFGLTRDLAALTTASIELEGAETVALIEEHYFRNPARSLAELTQVTQALSLHGTEGRTELRRRIVASYGRLLDHHPEMAARVAADLFAWKRTELHEELTRAAADSENLTDAERSTLRRYLQTLAAVTETPRADDCCR